MWMNAVMPKIFCPTLNWENAYPEGILLGQRWQHGFCAQRCWATCLEPLHPNGDRHPLQTPPARDAVHSHRTNLCFSFEYEHCLTPQRHTWNLKLVKIGLVEKKNPLTEFTQCSLPLLISSFLQCSFLSLVPQKGMGRRLNFPLKMIWFGLWTVSVKSRVFILLGGKNLSMAWLRNSRYLCEEHKETTNGSWRLGCQPEPQFQQVWETQALAPNSQRNDSVHSS